MGQICGNGNVGENFFHDRFFDAQGHLKPDVSSGYYSKLFQFDDTKPLVALTIRDMWSYACFCGSPPQTNYFTPMGCHDHYSGYRNWFCANLYDAGGNKVTNPPPICGGTGPEVLNYSTTQAAATDIVESGIKAALEAKYDATDIVKKIVGSGIVLALLILIIFMIL